MSASLSLSLSLCRGRGQGGGVEFYRPAGEGCPRCTVAGNWAGPYRNQAGPDGINSPQVPGSRGPGSPAFVGQCTDWQQAVSKASWAHRLVRPYKLCLWSLGRPAPARGQWSRLRGPCSLDPVAAGDVGWNRTRLWNRTGEGRSME